MKLLGGCHLLYTVGLNVVIGWVSFIEHNGFKCWITHQLWLTYISFYYVQVLIFTSLTQHQGRSDGLKWLAFCTYWLDHFGRKNGFMSFLVDTIGFVILILIKLFMDNCGLFMDNCSPVNDLGNFGLNLIYICTWSYFFMFNYGMHIYLFLVGWWDQ